MWEMYHFRESPKITYGYWLQDTNVYLGIGVLRKSVMDGDLMSEYEYKQ